MDIEGKTIWQVGAGDTKRSYGNICLSHDVMIVGSGKLGRYDERKYPGDKHLRDFCRKAQAGDIVLLRLGTSHVLAVGEIAGEYEFSEAFADVDGWNLQHYRRVRWFKNAARKFDTRTLGARVRTFGRVKVGSVRDWVARLKVEPEQYDRPLSEIPAPGKELDIRELAHLLFLEGLPSEYVDNLTSVLESVSRVARWYSNEEKRPKGRPSERETVTYLVVPVLFALGWSHQTAAIEWNNIDVALFERMPPEDENLTAVVEAKLLGKSVFSPVGKASTYATKPGRENCRRVVVTDGIRYAFFRRSERSGELELKAYWNILQMRQSYPIYPCGGAVEAIIGMAR